MTQAQSCPATQIAAAVRLLEADRFVHPRTAVVTDRGTCSRLANWYDRDCKFKLHALTPIASLTAFAIARPIGSGTPLPTALHFAETVNDSSSKLSGNAEAFDLECHVEQADARKQAEYQSAHAFPPAYTHCTNHSRSGSPAGSSLS